LIIDVNKTTTLDAGISMGIGNAPTSNETLMPGVKLNFTSENINKILGGFSGLGLLNLGKVTPDFYMSISALEFLFDRLFDFELFLAISLDVLSFFKMKYRSSVFSKIKPLE